MKCVYCAENIKDEAQLCRFCGAFRVDGQWHHPATPPVPKKNGKFTMVTSGWLLVLSGAWVLLTCTSPVPLFGAVRDGIVAVLYNGIFGALLLSMGYALASRKTWALKATVPASVVYTLDKATILFDSQARSAMGERSQLLNSLETVMGVMVDQITVLVSLSFLAGWWCLIIYIFINRDYFRPATLSRNTVR